MKCHLSNDTLNIDLEYMSGKLKNTLTPLLIFSVKKYKY